MSTQNTQANQEGVLDVASQKQTMVFVTKGSQMGKSLPSDDVLLLFEGNSWDAKVYAYAKMDFNEDELVDANFWWNNRNNPRTLTYLLEDDQQIISSKMFWRKDECKLVTVGAYEGQMVIKQYTQRMIDGEICTNRDEFCTINGEAFFEDDMETHGIVETECGEYAYECDCTMVIVGRFGHEDWALDSNNDFVYHDGDTYLNEEIANDCGIRFYGRFDEWMSEEQYRERIGEDANDGYDEHHNTPQYHHFAPRAVVIENNKGDFNFGLEIEKVDREVKVDINAHDLHNKNKWCKEQDASLRDENGSNYKGFEVVTPVYSLFRTKWKKDFEDDDVTKILDAKFNTKCGGHFNLSSTKYSPSELFEGLSSFFPLLYSLYESRIQEGYCQAQKKDRMSYSPEKRTAIYKQSNRIEFRIFPAVRSKQNAIWRIDLVKIFVKNINCGEIDVLKMMVNEKSPLHKHLMKVYTKEDIDSKVFKYIKYAREYNNKNLDMPKSKESKK